LALWLQQKLHDERYSPIAYETNLRLNFFPIFDSFGDVECGEDARDVEEQISFSEMGTYILLRTLRLVLFGHRSKMKRKQLTRTDLSNSK